MRIHIIGGPGSGKTTLALKLANDLHMPFHELDAIWWTEKMAAERPLNEVLPRVNEIAAQPTWITEGTYITCVHNLLLRADFIIWLDVSCPLALWRIVKRHIHTSIQRTNRYPSVFRLLQFMQESILYYTRPTWQNNQYTRSATIFLLNNFKSKTIRCTNREEVEAILKIVLADTSVYENIADNASEQIQSQFAIR